MSYILLTKGTNISFYAIKVSNQDSENSQQLTC
jgi:hypothetical protein